MISSVFASVAFAMVFAQPLAGDPQGAGDYPETIDSAGPVEEQPETGWIQGIVFSGDGNKPLSGVGIWTLGGDEVVTNLDGAFLMELPPGDHQLEFEVPGRSPGLTDPVHVVGGEVSEVLITIDPVGDDHLVEIEAADVSYAAALDKAYEGAYGLVTGTVTHFETGKPVDEARVFVKGFPLEGETGADGTFEMEIPVGTNVLTVVHPQFSTFTLDDVEVVEGETTEVTAELTPVSIMMEEFTVSAPKVEGAVVELLEERKAAGAVSDVIGAEQMKKSGDSDAAGALKRVTGVTVVGGKYVYVRGLGERYSSTLLNGSSLPSPEPERRVVPLDMFPANMLESMVIQKTYSPDMPGEFGGGVVQLRTIGFPSEFKASISLSAGFATGTTFATGHTYDGGKLDWLGIDDGTRAMPQIVYDASRKSLIMETDRFGEIGYPIDDVQRFGQSLQNVWNLETMTVPPDLGITATLGNSYAMGKNGVAGFMVSLVYKNQWDKVDDKVFRVYKVSEGEVTKQHSYLFSSLENEITLAGILSIGFDFNEWHKLRLTSILDRITDDEARNYIGRNEDVATDIDVTRLRWIERMLFVQQVHGFHVFPQAMKLELDWKYNFSLAMRSEPDRREYRYDYEEGIDLWYMSERLEGNSRFYSDLLDLNHDFSIDLALPFQQWTAEEAKAKIGFTGVFKDREVDTRRFRFMRSSQCAECADLMYLSPEVLFSPSMIATDRFVLQEFTQQTDNYLAEQQVLGGYAMIDLPLGAGFRLIGGLRVEYSRQWVKTFEKFAAESTPSIARLLNTDVLPAAVISWDLPHDMVLRLGYSRTLSRPDFRELSEAAFNDVTGGRMIMGNPELQRAVLDNVDLRWEWYFAPGESVSVGFFYKRFTDPIEEIVIPSAQHTITYENAKGANNLGVEVEFRKSFEFMHEKMRDFYIAGNASYIYSKIELTGEGSIQTNDNRALQGQSPFVINVTLGYDNVDIGTSAVLLYNVYGKRISSVGASGLPDTFEQPFHQLDFVLIQKLAHGFKLGFKAKNILDLPVRQTQGKYIVVRYTRGRVFSLSLSKSF